MIKGAAPNRDRSNPFVEGALQIVHQSGMGVDLRTGANKMGIMAGSLRGRKAADIVRMLNQPSAKGLFAGEPLVPVYDGTWTVVGYERSMDPEVLKMVRKNTHLGEMMGAWFGRHEEESLAEGFNEELVDLLKKNWEDGKAAGRESEYVNVSDENQLDEIMRENWGLVPIATKEYIDGVFANEPGFMVRRDMAEMVLPPFHRTLRRLRFELR